MTTIELTDEGVKDYIEYQRRFPFFKLLESVGAFSIKGGSITIQFDRLGQIVSLDKQEHFRL